MFSDQLRKIDEAPPKILLLVAACLVMACQLVAMALVAGKQVQKAQMRGDRQASRQMAVASCVESSRGVAVKDCFRPGSVGLEIHQDRFTAKRSVQYGAASEAGEIDTTATPATSAAAITGFTPASFAAR